MAAHMNCIHRVLSNYNSSVLGRIWHLPYIVSAAPTALFSHDSYGRQTLHRCYGTGWFGPRTKFSYNRGWEGFGFDRGSKCPVWPLSMIALPVGLKNVFGSNDDEKETPEDILTKHIKGGLLCIQKGDYEKAERILHVALKMAQDMNHESGVTYIYDVLANLAVETENYRKAEKIFKDVLQRLLSRGVAQDDLRVCHISLKLAKLYEELKELDKSEQGYQFCLDTLEKLVSAGKDDKDTLLLYALTMEYYARFLLDARRGKEAMKHLQKALSISVDISGNKNEQSVVLLSDMGAVSSADEDWDAAFHYFTEALNIAQQLEGYEDIASLMVNLGWIHLQRKEYDEAKVWCNKGKAAAQKLNDQETLLEAGECLKEMIKQIKMSSL